MQEIHDNNSSSTGVRRLYAA